MFLIRIYLYFTSLYPQNRLNSVLKVKNSTKIFKINNILKIVKNIILYYNAIIIYAKSFNN